MQLALQCALSNSLSTLAVVVHEHLPKPLSTHYNGNFDDEPEFRSLEPPLQSLQPAGNFEVSERVIGEVLSSPDGPPQPIPASNFKFHRMTLGEATIKEPLTIATGLVNTFTNFVKDIHAHHRPQDSPAGDIGLEPVDNNQNICGQNDLNTPFEGGSDEDF